MTEHVRCDCDREQLASQLLPLAMQFAAIVHEESPDASAAFMAAIPASHWMAFTVILAALVPVDTEPRKLLAWVRHDPYVPALPAYVDGSGEMELLPYSADEGDWSEDQLRAAHRMHRRGIRDLRVVTGERIYDRHRLRQRRSSGPRRVEVAS